MAKMKKRKIVDISSKKQDVLNEYNDLVVEYASALIEKKLDDELNEKFYKRWFGIACAWNHWHQVKIGGMYRLENPMKMKYLKLRKIYNKHKRDQEYID